MSISGLAIGVLAASAKQLGDLGCMVRGAGYEIKASVSIQDGFSNQLPDVDAWIVNLDLNEPIAQAVIDYLDHIDLPVIYEDDLQLVADKHDSTQGLSQETPTVIRQRQERRLATKLRQLVRESNKKTKEKPLSRAKCVWVLAASTGGPEAVAQFLKGIPDDLDGVAFLYAQHIYQKALGSLRRVITNNCSWDTQNTDEARVIREKTVYLVSPGYQIELSDAGVVSPLNEPWGGDFQPCIDHVIAKVARVYGKRSGLIVFSGMGEDGAKNCKLFRYRGGQIWIQSKSSCTIDSMPASAEKTGCVDFSAEPLQLAQQLVYFQQRGTLSPKIKSSE